MNKYKELLERPEWKEKRERILERDGHKCQFCGSTDKQLQVHHFNYDAPTPWDVPDKYLITLCKDCHKNYHFTPLGLRECDKHIPDCGWEGFSIERLKKQGFHINGNHAMLKLNGFTLFLTHQGDGENMAVATLFKDGSQKRYHEDVVATHLMLDDYLEDYLDFNHGVSPHDHDEENNHGVSPHDHDEEKAENLTRHSRLVRFSWIDLTSRSKPKTAK